MHSPKIFTGSFYRIRLQPDASDREAAAYMVGVIQKSFLNFRTRAYDMIQYHQNQIWYQPGCISH